MRSIRLMLLAALLVLPTPLYAQVINPTTVVFTPSPDHALLIGTTTTPMVSNYELQVMLEAVPTTPVRTVNLGKPTPVNNEISLVVAELSTLPTGSYLTTVSAVGPGGAGVSAPPVPFIRIAPPRPPTNVIIAR